jgi:hypothetical protein
MTDLIKATAEEIGRHHVVVVQLPEGGRAECTCKGWEDIPMSFDDAMRVGYKDWEKHRAAKVLKRIEEET